MCLIYFDRSTKEGSRMRPANDASSAVPEPTERYRPGYEIVAEQLLQYIAEQGLRPGDRLPTEQGLAEALDATRNVTREAVKVLAAIGRLHVRKGAGIFVAAPATDAGTDELAHYKPTDMEQVLMLLEYRRLVETETARRAAGLATPIQVRAIREAAAHTEESAARGAVEEFASADATFHSAIAIASQNIFLQASVTNVRRYADQSDVLLFHGDVPGSLEFAGRQHAGIAEAIAAGDPDLAVTLMAQHIDTTQHQFERKIRDRIFSRERAL
jgi:DNA-binding FadR family transcriptional regulator